MDSDLMWITALAQDYINSQSFGFSSFPEAKYKLTYKVGLCQKVVVFDRLSLCFYKSNFSSDEYRQFWKDINQFYHPSNNDNLKMRKEYATLFIYLSCISKLDDYSILKQERPDFTMRKEGYCVGVEVTELTTPYEKVMDKIVSLTINERSIDELKSKAENQHGQKANGYYYYNLGTSIGVGTTTQNISRIKEKFVQQVINKYKKYEEKMKDYDEFIILCDARQGITITSKSDLDVLIYELKSYPFSQSFEIAFLWDNGITNCSQYRLGPLI